MGLVIVLLGTAIGLFILVQEYSAYKAQKRAKFIRQLTLPANLYNGLKQHYPHLSEHDLALVKQGLQQFFLAYLQHKNAIPLAMPSYIVDELWHAFILRTKAYQDFCQRAFGRFLHHTPAVVWADSLDSRSSLQACWHSVCLEEGINPFKPEKLPLLFALDRQLQIPHGWHYYIDGIDNLDHNASAAHADRRYSVSPLLTQAPEYRDRSTASMSCSGSDGGGGGD